MNSARLGRALLAAIALSGSAGANQASAQTIGGQILGNMIGQLSSEQRYVDCMRGTPMSAKEVTETRATAYAAMNGYWQAVRGGGAADATAFFVNDAKVGWASGDTRLGREGLARISDPLAAAGATIGAEPIGYARSGNGGSVWGQWRVTTPDGSFAGTYDALFRRNGKTWRLSQLTVVPANVYLDPVIQYCGTPNDVLPYRLATAQNRRDDAVNRARMLTAKADAARADVDRAVASGNAAQIAEARRRADEAARKLVEANADVKNTVYMNERVRAEAATAEARKAAAIAALKS